jgi:hypothetical protein
LQETRESDRIGGRSAPEYHANGSGENTFPPHDSHDFAPLCLFGVNSTTFTTCQEGAIDGPLTGPLTQAFTTADFSFHIICVNAVEQSLSRPDQERLITNLHKPSAAPLLRSERCS